MTLANYYTLKSNLEPNLNKINLTYEEISGGFTIEKLNKENVLTMLNDSLPFAKREGVTKDTIEVLKEYLKK